jgi:hydroxymethylbilane synthase
MRIRVGARRSPLSQIQVHEVLEEIRKHHPNLIFESILVETTGDRDQNTSLRILDKTDFFTKEIDVMVLSGKCRIGIHSAKDLPEPLSVDLEVAALTKGVDSSDALVFRPGESLASLQAGGIIATSSGSFLC